MLLVAYVTRSHCTIVVVLVSAGNNMTCGQPHFFVLFLSYTTSQPPPPVVTKILFHFFHTCPSPNESKSQQHLKLVCNCLVRRRSETKLDWHLFRNRWVNTTWPGRVGQKTKWRLKWTQKQKSFFCYQHLLNSKPNSNELDNKTHWLQTYSVLPMLCPILGNSSKRLKLGDAPPSNLLELLTNSSSGPFQFNQLCFWNIGALTIVYLEHRSPDQLSALINKTHRWCLWRMFYNCWFVCISAN